jgi:hypothetical protein
MFLKTVPASIAKRCPTLRCEMMPSIALGCMVLVMSGETCGNQTIPLAGDWRFEIAGTNETAFSRELNGKIHLPGSMDDAGLGPKNTKAPTLYDPCRFYNYAGPAWHQRDIDVPAGWSGQRVTLFLERCRWVTSVWLDDKCFGSRDSLITPHVYNPSQPFASLAELDILTPATNVL